MIKKNEVKLQKREFDFQKNKIKYTWWLVKPRSKKVFVYILKKEAVLCKFLLIGQHWHDHVKGSIEEYHLWVHSCFSSNVPHFLFVLSYLELGVEWSYRCCFVGCCFHDLSNIAYSILLQFLSSFFSMRFVSIQVVHRHNFCLEEILFYFII